MQIISELLQGSMASTLISFLGVLIYSKTKNRKIKSETKHIDNENITIFSNAANILLEPLYRQLKYTQEEAEDLRTRVKELTREISAQSIILDELTVKLERSTNKANYYQSEYERITGLPIGSRSTQTYTSQGGSSRP